MLSDMTTVFCSQHRANMRAIRFNMGRIYFCVGGYSVLEFLGTEKFSGSSLGGISKQDPDF